MSSAPARIGTHCLITNGVASADSAGLALRLPRRSRLLADDLLAEIDALVADVDARPGDQLRDRRRPLAAKRATLRTVHKGGSRLRRGHRATVARTD